jgi:hypothetical protein
MQMRPITANPSQIMVEQLVASGLKYVFYNSGSREAHFFDALYAHPNIHGILALHEGSVTAMAGGYTQARLDPAVMVVHLGAGLAQCMGQLINVWTGSLPVVVMTFAGDTGSHDAPGQRHRQPHCVMHAGRRRKPLHPSSTACAPGCWCEGWITPWSVAAVAW